MKYLQLPCNWFEQPIIRQAIRKDEGFGFKVIANLLLKIGNEFQMGDWVKSGYNFDQVPFSYDMTIKDWKGVCMVTDDEDKKFWELLSESAKLGLLSFKKSEYSMIITLPQVADMQDETNRKKTKKLFGKPRLSADEMKAIAEGKSGNILEQTREEDIKQNSGLVKDSNKRELIPNTDEHFNAYERRNNRYFQAKYGE
jgi:hypothetical protein